MAGVVALPAWCGWGEGRGADGARWGRGMGTYRVRNLASLCVDADSEEAAAAAVVGALHLRNQPGADPVALPIEVSLDGVHWTAHRVVVPDMTEEEAAAAAAVTR